MLNRRLWCEMRKWERKKNNNLPSGSGQVLRLGNGLGCDHRLLPKPRSSQQLGMDERGNGTW